MAEGLSFRIGADVNDALRGLQQVEQRMRGTAAAGQSFGTQINRTTQQLNKLPKSSNEATQSLINLSRVAQDAPYGFIGIANNINPLLESFQRLKATTGTTGGAFKELGKSLIGPAGVGLAIGVVSSLLVTFGDRIFGAGKKAKEAKTAADELRKSIDGVFASAAKEATQVTTLVALLKSETETRERKLAAIKELQDIQPEVFKNLKLEGDVVSGLDASYQNYLQNLRTVIAVKVKQAQLDQLLEKQLRQQGVTLTKSEKAFMDGVDSLKEYNRQRALAAGEKDPFIQDQQSAKRLQSDIDNLIKDLIELSKGIEVKELKINKAKVKVEPEITFDGLQRAIPLESIILLKKEESLSVIGRQMRELEDSLKPIVPKIEFDPLKATPELTEGLKRIKEELLQTAAVGQFVGRTLADGFGSAFDAIQQGENVLIAFGESIKQVVLDLIKLAIQTLIVRAITNLFAPGLGSIGGLTGGASSLFGGFRAGGGPVEAGRAYVVGENRPELFVPNVSGRIIPSVNPGISTGGRSSFGGNRQYVRGQNLVLVTARTNRSQRR